MTEEKKTWTREEALALPLYDPDADDLPELVRLKSGAIFSTVKKHIVGMSPDLNVHAFTPGDDGTGKQAHAKRFDDLADAFVEGLAKSLLDDEPAEIDPNKLKARTARALGRKAGELLKGTKNIRGLAELLNSIAKIGRLAPTAFDVEIVREPPPPVLPSPEMMEFFSKLLDKLEPPKTIEGVVTDVKEK